MNTFLVAALHSFFKCNFYILYSKPPEDKSAGNTADKG